MALFLVMMVASAAFFVGGTMRTVYIDLTQDGHCRRGSIDVGYTGEHNATELVIAVPQAMADESDYLTVVFLSDGKIIRSEKITEVQETGKPYRTGNQVHILLSKRLTQNPTLGLQVEGYRKNEHGTAVLLGKSQFISSLHFHLSPQGDVDPAGGIAPDELSDLMDWWRNREDDAAGIRKCAFFKDLPADAEEGDLAYVINDSGQITEPFEFQKTYAAFRIKDDYDRDAFLALPPMPEEWAEDMTLFSRYAPFSVRNGDNDGICYCAIMYYEGVGSLFVISEFASEEDVCDYYPPDSEQRNVPTYVFISGEGDVGPLLYEGEDEVAQPVPVTRGWYKLTYYISDYYIDHEYIEDRTTFRFEPVAREDILPLETLKNCYLKIGDRDFYPYAAQIARAVPVCFDVFGDSYHPHGLYLFENGQWKLQKSLPALTAADRPHLPLVAEEGQIGVAGADANLFNRNSGYMYVGATWDRLYINPVLGGDSWLCDCRVKCRYGYRNTADWSIAYFDSGSGLDLTVNTQAGFALLSLSFSPWDSYRQHWLYAKAAGRIAIPGSSSLGNTFPVNLRVKEGWNRITQSSGAYSVEDVDPFCELPNIIFTNYGQDYLMEITEYECAVHSQRILANVPFYESDDGEGLWYFSDGRWRKADA